MASGITKNEYDSGWLQFGTNFIVNYRKVGRIVTVYVAGEYFASGSWHTTSGTLPEEFRPPYGKNIVCGFGDGIMVVNTDGTIQMQCPNGQWGGGLCTYVV